MIIRYAFFFTHKGITYIETPKDDSAEWGEMLIRNDNGRFQILREVPGLWSSSMSRVLKRTSSQLSKERVPKEWKDSDLREYEGDNYPFFEMLRRAFRKQHRVDFRDLVDLMGAVYFEDSPQWIHSQIYGNRFSPVRCSKPQNGRVPLPPDILKEWRSVCEKEGCYLPRSKKKVRSYVLGTIIGQVDFGVILTEN